MRCDLCAKGSEAGLVVVIEDPPAPAFERRKPGPRHQHRTCADNLNAHRAEERAKTTLWFDRQLAEFSASRLVAS